MDVPNKTRRFSEAFDDFLREVDLAELDLNPDEIFSGIRDRSPGRDVDLPPED